MRLDFFKDNDHVFEKCLDEIMNDARGWGERAYLSKFPHILTAEFLDEMRSLPSLPSITSEEWLAHKAECGRQREEMRAMRQREANPRAGDVSADRGVLDG
ncbi:MAG: hypothetical protein ACREPW_02800 [Candidatus Binataceae bacterium]